ncbi:MAG: hypothetical protein COV46_01865 [Deltaproteobacteria bacterium CG11_big_fil_rev_8_21_14_0_20_49_13]|nr:MAG: hypothetical protein COV46_01865 [Deltaproteobacteria bacterium CG11_big_fil_rev_8_21_14_0_20_49_13]
MKRSVVLVACLTVCFVASFLFSSCSGKGKMLVTVNGTAITESDLDFLSTINPRLKMQLNTPFGKKQILDNMVEQELLYQAALKRGLQRDASAKAKIELYKKVIIAQAYIESEMKKAAKVYYESNKAEFERLQISDILIKYAAPAQKDTKAKKGAPAPKGKVTRSKEVALKLANEIKAKIEGGMEFAAAAKEYSEDTVTKNSGGELGRVSKNDPRLERRGYGPLLEKAFSMQVGEVAGPIETSDGFHLIAVTKGAELEPFEQVEQGIMMKMSGEERNKILAELKKNAKVVYPGEKKEEKKPEAVKSATPPAPTAPVAPNAPVTPKAPEAPKAK